MRSKKPPKDGRQGAKADDSECKALERSVIDLILEVKDGRTDPRLLSPEDRRACVAQLGSEGLSVAEIAQVLRHSDRTILRDRAALQAAAALTHDPALAGQVAGRLVTEAALCIDRLRRVARDRATPPQAKIEAERVCFSVMVDQVKLLQSLGYLPTAGRQLEAHLTHSMAEVPSGPELDAELERLRAIHRDQGGSQAGLRQLEGLVARARAAAEIEARLAAASQDEAAA